MAITLSYGDIIKETTSVKGSPLLFLPLRELAQLLKAKRSTPDILYYWESETRTETIEEKEILQLICSLLPKIFRYPREEEKTYPLEIPTGFYIPSTIIPVVEKEKSSQELEQEALFFISEKFSKIEKVKSIYVQRYREELQIQVLLSTNQYEDDLMDTLLDIEYDIRKMFPEIVFEFFYPPAGLPAEASAQVGISEKKDFIHPQAECIYMR